MLVTIHQPNYLPWMGFFHKASQADLFVLLDTVQFSKNSIQNRNRIKTAQGELWLTVPVLTKGRGLQSTDAIEINNGEKWAEKHFRSITNNYARAPFARDYLPALEEVYAKGWHHLAELNETLIGLMAEWLGVTTPMVRASELGVSGESTQLLLAICQKVGAGAYLSGPSGRRYLDEAAFQSAGIALHYHEFEHPVYPQLFGEFVPNLSALDLLLNCGEDSAAVVRGQGGCGG